MIQLVQQPAAVEIALDQQHQSPQPRKPVFMLTLRHLGGWAASKACRSRCPRSQIRSWTAKAIESFRVLVRNSLACVHFWVMFHSYFLHTYLVHEHLALWYRCLVWKCRFWKNSGGGRREVSVYMAAWMNSIRLKANPGWDFVGDVTWGKLESSVRF